MPKIPTAWLRRCIVTKTKSTTPDHSRNSRSHARRSDKRSVGFFSVVPETLIVRAACLAQKPRNDRSMGHLGADLLGKPHDPARQFLRHCHRELGIVLHHA